MRLPDPRIGSGSSGFFTSSANVGVTSNVVGPSGQLGVRMTRLETSSLALYTPRNEFAMIQNPVLGDVYTLLYWVRTSRDFQVTSTLGYGGGSAAGTQQPVDVLAGVMTLVRSVHTIGAGHVNAGNAFPKFANITVGAEVGEWYEIYKVMLVKGVYLGEFSNGDTPGWKWRGAANASPSVGYPYTLESIAGRPLVTITTPGTVELTGLTAFDDRSMYTVFEIINPASAIETLAGVATSSPNAIGAAGTSVVRTGSNAQAVIHHRYDLGSGGTIALVAGALRTTGRHVIGVGHGAALTKRFGVADGGAYNEYAVAGATTGFTSNRVGLADVTANNVPIVAHIFGQYHNEQTARAVNKWLANKYGLAA